MEIFKVKAKLSGFLAFIVLLFTTSVAQAQLPPASSWVSSGPGGDTVVSTAYGVNFSYNYNNTSVYNGQSWQFSTVAAETESITYNWDYSGIHAWFAASAKLSVFVTRNGESNITDLYNSTVSGDFSAAGTATLQLTAGDTYGFIIYGINYDSNSFLMGSLEISRAPVIRSYVSGNSFNGWYTSDVDLNWMVRDGVPGSFTSSGCASRTIKNDSTVTGITYTCTATSSVGTVSKSVIIKRDTAAPNTVDDAPTGWVDKEAPIHLTANDGGSGVAATYYKVDNGETQTGTSVYLASNDIHTLSYWSVDNAGNAELPKTKTVMIHDEIFHADIVSLTNQNVTVTVSFPKNAQTKQFSMDNQTWLPYTGPIVVSENKTIYAKYQDTQGSWSLVSSYEITNINKVAPVTTTDMGTINPATKYVTLNLYAMANASGVAATYYTVDNGDRQTGNSIELRKQGMHTIKYWSVDSLGNVENESSIDVKVELLPIRSTGEFRIDDVIKLIHLGTLQQTDMNDDGVFNNLDIAIMLNAITPITLLE